MSIHYYWNKFVLMFHGKALKNCEIDKNACINYCSNVINSSMSRYSYCGYNCWIVNTQIGAFCSISNGVRIGGPSHPIDWVSTSPVFHSGRNMFRKHFSEHYFNPFKKTVIGNDVWIGENALVKAGVTIANGAVVGMGSVVTRDIGPYEIWVGNPARLLRKRFSDENIELLLKIKWWDFSESELKRFAQDITEIGMIRDKY